MSPTKRLLVAIAALFCLIAAAAVLLIFRWRRPMPAANAGTPPSLLSLLPPDAPAVGYIDVVALKRLQGNLLADILGLAGTNPQQDRDYQDFVRDTGFDYTRDLDHAAIAFWPGLTNNDDRTLAVAEGRFDQAKIKAYALKTGKIIASGSQQVYLVPGSPAVALQFLDAKRIAIASGPAPDTILAGIKPSPRDPVMQKRIDRVAGAPIFAVARTDSLPPSFFDNLRSVPELQSIVRTIRGFTLAGQPEGDLVHATLDAECDSMASAVRLATVADTLRFLGSMALSDPKTRQQMSKEQLSFLSALLSQAKLSHQDQWVRLMIDVTPVMLGEGPGAGPHAGATKPRSSKPSKPIDEAFAVASALWITD
jgi:hypothetical protein